MLCSYRQVLQSTTALIGVAFLVFAPPVSAFDPDEGKLPPPAASHLPDTSVLYDAPAMGQLSPAAPPAPLAVATNAGPPGYISPLPPLQMPMRPLYPGRSMDAAPSDVPSVPDMPAPAYPPVSPDVAAKAKAVMDETPAAPPVAAVPAPTAPIAAPADGPVEPVDLAAPVTVAPPASKLSDQTREILSTIPSRVDTVKPQKKSEVKMDRVSPDIAAVLGEGAKEDQFDAVGLSIRVRRPGLDANYELNRAYTALMGGETRQAVDIYKDILSVEPKNQEALFGLAATYHRQGAIEKARPIYGMLLKLNPNHREGLNNFLVLVGDESPEDALPELERLEQRNPDFSPIPAQSAIVLDKLGYKDLAREKMLRAIELAPENLTYKYNLAIMLDKQGRYKDASALYKVLIAAALRGEKVPAPVDVMQKRLNYLTTAANSPVPSGG